MIASYYAKNLDMSDVFDKLNIAKCLSYKEHLNKHNVIYISFNTGNDDFKTYEEYKAYFVDETAAHTRDFSHELAAKELAIKTYIC